MMGTVSNPAGMLQPSNLWGVYNNLRFVIQQALANVQTATIVQVVACSNSGGVSPVGTVDVQILVNQITGQAVATPHVTMYGLPYLRIQGGANAVILDPQPGDIGIAVFASRDITNVKSTKAQANPPTFRTHDFADGMYLGGLLNGTPSQYIQFNSSGISVISPTEVKITAPSILLSDAGSAEALVLKPFYDFWNTNILPFLQGLGYTGPVPPTNSVTTVIQGQ
jgi:hypothetical protein